MRFLSLTGKNTVCQQKRQDVLDQASIIGGRSVVEQDTHMSICTKNGEFEVKQCHGSPAYCWCVDQQGKIVHKIAQGNEDIQCDEGISPIAMIKFFISFSSI